MKLTQSEKVQIHCAWIQAHMGNPAISLYPCDNDKMKCIFQEADSYIEWLEANNEPAAPHTMD